VRRPPIVAAVVALPAPPALAADEEIAVTDDTGAFRIADVPPQTDRVTLWHEGYRPRGVGKDGRPVYDEPRTITKQVTIAPRGAATVQFELK